VRIDSECVISDYEFLHVLARDALGLLRLFRFDFARGVANVARVVLQRGEASARAAAVGIDKHVGFHFAVGFGPAGGELHHRIRAFDADFDGFLAACSFRTARNIPLFFAAARKDQA
jgi:hypothetical protein